METVSDFRNIIEDALLEYTRIPYAYGDLKCEAVFDRINDRYLLVTVGWDRGEHVHYTLAHLEIIADKIWILRDETEDGIALDLMRAGVPKQRIVLGFHPPEARKLTEFAPA